MADLTSICGQIRGLAPKLLTKGQIDRMVGAKDADEAFRVLTELQYADYIDQETTLSDFDAIITQGLFETKNLLLSGTTDHAVADFLTLQFDVNNLKRALKQRLLQEAKEFSVDESFSKLGTLSATEINKIVFDGQPAGGVSSVITNAVNTAINEAKNVRDIEFSLDAALFTALSEILEERPSETLQSYLNLWADSAQIRNIARSVLVGKETLPEAAFLPAGGVSATAATKVSNYAEFKKFLEASRFTALASRLEDNATPAEQLMQLEKGFDAALNGFLHNASIGNLSSPTVLLDYFNQRLQNARTLKLIMYGKLNGLQSEKIYKLLEA